MTCTYINWRANGNSNPTYTQIRPILISYHLPGRCRGHTKSIKSAINSAINSTMCHWTPYHDNLQTETLNNKLNHGYKSALQFLQIKKLSPKIQENSEAWLANARVVPALDGTVYLVDINITRGSSPDLGLKLRLIDYCTSHIFQKKNDLPCSARQTLLRCQQQNVGESWISI